MRRVYEISQQQLDRLLDACQLVPLIAIHLGMPCLPQERANNAWDLLGRELGFKHMTVAPIAGRSERFFTAEPMDTAQCD